MATYERVITNDLTGERYLVKANDLVTFQSRLNSKVAKWNKQNHQQISAAEAQDLTKSAIQRIKAFKNILKYTLKINDAINWKKFKNAHGLKEPVKENYFADVDVYGGLQKVPLVNKINFIRTKYEEKLISAYKSYEKDQSTYDKKLEKWRSNIDWLREAYEAVEVEGVEKYIDLVLERSQYPEDFNLFYEVVYKKDQKLLLLDVEIPSKSEFPRILEYKYVKSKNEIVPKEMKSKDFEDLYNDTIYQIILRTIHEALESDYQEVVDLVVCNIKVDKTNKKTGHNEIVYIASLQVSRDEFIEINLEKVVAQEAFRHLKGVTAGSLIELSPVRPIMKLNREDGRIITADSVVDNFDETTNLATIDWKDFEVLVRDLIAKEFSGEGAQVEVTRASRDLGVDAIAFDEDPIRGGKFVIQAKRYNKVVPLSAVRDLYGTVVNEGAVKGILITTSYYGKDSLEFAKDKPLKLINGEEMLYMFNKHGYKFKIALKKSK